MFSQACVKNTVHSLPDTHPPADTLWEDSISRQTPPPGRQRTVRILLECMLVVNTSALSPKKRTRKRSKNKRQTSKKIFAFAWSEHCLTRRLDLNRGFAPRGNVCVISLRSKMRQQISWFSSAADPGFQRSGCQPIILRNFCWSLIPKLAMLTLRLYSH